MVGDNAAVGLHHPSCWPFSAVVGIVGPALGGNSMKIAIGVLCAVWLVVGAYAANQRHYYGHGLASCDAAGTVAATIAVGPLNYRGLTPQVTCPEPSA